MTHAEWLAEAIRRFGPDPLGYTFVCPSCGDEAAVRDWPPQMRTRAGQECIGVALLDVSGEREWIGRGCQWRAYGLISGPWEITMPDGKVLRAFAFADPTSGGAEVEPG
jgi:hypothetical protein